MILPKNHGIAITGAAGWLGRELFSALQKTDYDLLPLGRSNETITLGSNLMRVHEWNPEILEEHKPKTLVHLAYVTRERIAEIGAEEYKQANRMLRVKIESAISETGITNLVVASSGVALNPTTDLYAELKADDEIYYQGLAQRYGVNLVIARAWSLTGRYCTKPREFLIYDVVRQLLSGNSEIKLNSSSLVWRKYVDAGEFLRCCLEASVSGWSGVIDSTGDLAEASELVKLASTKLNRNVNIVRPNLLPAKTASLYFSNNSIMDEWFDKLGLSRTALEWQTASIIDSFKNGLIAR